MCQPRRARQSRLPSRYSSGIASAQGPASPRQRRHRAFRRSLHVATVSLRPRHRRARSAACRRRRASTAVSTCTVCHRCGSCGSAATDSDGRGGRRDVECKATNGMRGADASAASMARKEHRRCVCKRCGHPGPNATPRRINGCSARAVASAAGALRTIGAALMLLLATAAAVFGRLINYCDIIYNYCDKIK
jgi:hypothetical protein